MSLLALPTAFVQPATCTDIFSTSVLTTTITYTQVEYGSTTLSTTAYEASITVSDPADPRFAACQPPGWASVAPESRFSFSPAVCPSGWTAYDLDTVGDVSTAFCCARYDLHYLRPACSLANCLTNSVAITWTGRPG